MKMIFSFSRLSLYETCPYRFRLKYIEGKEEPVTKPAALGKAVHKAIEMVVKGSDPKEAVLNGIVEVDFHPEVSSEEVEELLKKAPVTSEMGETEVYFRLPLSDSPSAPEIQGYIDLVKQGEWETTLWDWKTNHKVYGVLDTYQLGIYAWALMKLKGTHFVTGHLYFLRFKKDITHVFSEEDAEKARQWAYDLAQEINSKLFLLDLMPEKEDEIFPPRPSSACHNCPFVIECYLKHRGWGI